MLKMEEETPVLLHEVAVVVVLVPQLRIGTEERVNTLKIFPVMETLDTLAVAVLHRKKLMLMEISLLAWVVLVVVQMAELVQEVHGAMEQRGQLIPVVVVLVPLVMIVKAETAVLVVLVLF
tara:strand:+ start:328 stop:690 length:363 start_codon:yes stop_codon:yes gene_type:complete